MSPKAVIFDMDGVIIDSEPLWRRAEISTFGEYGYELNDDMCRSTAGLRLTQVIEHWQRKFGYNDFVKNELFTKVHAEVIRLIKTEGKPFAGLLELLNHLNSLNYKIALASGSSYEIIFTVLEKFQIKSFFEEIRSGEEEEFSKPHPQIFINTAKKLNVAYEDCWVIEDSRNGVIAARAARMKVIAMPEKEVENDSVFSIADTKVKSLLDVTKLFSDY